MGRLNQDGTSPTRPSEPDPFRFGHRLVKRQLPNGRFDFDQIPLTLDDLLHPDEACVIVQNTPHQRDRNYLFGVLTHQLQDWPGAKVFDDLQIVWNDPGLRPHCPDLSVIFEVNNPDAPRTSFDVALEGVRPTLLIEIVSPDYRDNDVEKKYAHYHEARVPFYVIIDREKTEGPVSIHAYRYELDGYVELEPDEEGHLWLETVELWLGTGDNRVVCFDKKGRELGDYLQVTKELELAEKRAKAEARRAEMEAKARAAAEDRARMPLSEPKPKRGERQPKRSEPMRKRRWRKPKRGERKPKRSERKRNRNAQTRKPPHESKNKSMCAGSKKSYGDCAGRPSGVVTTTASSVPPSSPPGTAQRAWIRG